jgi:hypothetical protein
MSKAIEEIYKIILAEYGDAVSVEVFVNHDETRLIPHYKSNLSGLSMRKINGDWVDKREESK